MPKFSLHFTVDGTTQTITRTDNIKLRAGSKNYWYAVFTLDSSTFQGLDYLSATFGNEPYELNRGRAKIVPLVATPKDRDNPAIIMECQIPWEVLTRRGKVYVGVFAGDMLVTNEAEIEVTFAAPTMGGDSVPTPSWYSTFEAQLAAKVDKEQGKGLSTNDYNNTAKAKVDAIPENPQYTDTTYTAGSGINISEENVISATGSGGGSGTVFVTTGSPFADIAAAIEADKAVILRIEDGHGALYYPCTFYSSSENDTCAVFARDSEDEWIKVAYYCTLSEGVTTWTEEYMEGDFVSVNPQSFTDTAKATARANIGAGTYSKPNGGIPATDLASGVIPTVPEAATSAPADLAASAAVGFSTKYAKEDHKHKLPSAADVGALPSDTTYVSSVNGQSGAVSLTIPETYLVTVTGEGSGYWNTDRTMAQLNAAWAAGKVLRAKFPITFGNNTVTVEAPLVPLLSSGTPTGYMAYFTLTSGTHLYVYTFVQGGDNQADITTQDMSSDSAPAALGTAAAGVSIKYARADHVHPMPSASDIGAAPAITEVAVSDAGAVTRECADNTIYTFTGVLTSLTLTQATGAREYLVIFTTGSTAPTVTFPSGVVFPDPLTIEANKRYEISVRDGYAVAMSWAVSA